MEAKESYVIDAKPQETVLHDLIPYEEHKKRMCLLYERTKDRFYREGFKEGQLSALAEGIVSYVE